MRHCLLLVVLVAPAMALAAVPEEYRGVRSLALGGASLAVGTSNDALYGNPAAIGLTPRYHVELGYGFAPATNLSHFAASALDSRTSPLAGALAYSYDYSGRPGAKVALHRLYLALAYPISDRVTFGFSSQSIQGSFASEGKKTRTRLYTVALGLAAELGGGVSIGLSAQNIVTSELPELAPRTLGGGFAYNSPGFLLAADALFNIQDSKNTETTYRVGAEYFVQEVVPVRLGYQRAPAVRDSGKKINEDTLSAGLGWVNSSGGIEASVSHSLERPRVWHVAAAIKFFFQ